LVHVALLLWESLREEQYLAKTHGERYAHYQAHVGRFVPGSLKPYTGDAATGAATGAAAEVRLGADTQQK
jgi:hypothetical protein